MFYLKVLVKITQYNIRTGEYSMANINVYKRHTEAFSASYHRFQDISLHFCDFENIGQGHDVQLSQWRHLMENT